MKTSVRQSKTSVITKWDNFFVFCKEDQVALQSGASITKWDNIHFKVDQIVQSRAIITK